MTTTVQIIARALTFSFGPSVSTLTGLPDLLEIAVLPLADPTNPNVDITFAGGVKSQQIELTDKVNTVVFNLIPTNAPGLSAPLYYRVMWRSGLSSRTMTTDFVMPDVDCTWDDLVGGIGAVLDGTMYLQQADLGVPGRVAQLDDQGTPITSHGVQCALITDITALQNSLTAETARRTSDNSTLRNQMQNDMADQVNSIQLTHTNLINTAVVNLTGQVNMEALARRNADQDLALSILNLDTSLQGQIDTIDNQVQVIDTTLTRKADLDVNNWVPMSQINPEVYTEAIAVPNQTAMLALTHPPVHRGDIAVRPDGIFLLISNDPSQLSNWVSLSTVSSVNGHRGDVVLTPSDVGAIPVGGTIGMHQVNGLNTALSGKASQTDLIALQNSVTKGFADATLVRTVKGTIPTAQMPPEIALINSSNQITNKAGSIVATGGGGGGGGFDLPIPQTAVIGLTADLANRVLITDGRLTNARTPTAHAASHHSSGTDPLSLELTQVNGLSALHNNNALTPTSNAVNRIGSLETRVTDIEQGGGGGGGGGGTAASTTVFYESATTATEVTDYGQVFLHSPWGIDSDGTITGTIGLPYYLHSGVRAQDVAYPHITPNGHLQLHLWNESNPPDPIYALENDHLALADTVALKAEQADFLTLSGAVDLLAAQADLDALTLTVNAKANQSALNTTNTTVATKANQADLTALNATVATKANQADMTTAQNNITVLQNQMPNKADLIGGRVPLSQTSQQIPQSSIWGLTDTMALKADLAGPGTTVPLSQLPPQFPQSMITGLTGALAGKADLVGGMVPVGQLPPSCLTAVYSVANRASMLGLTTTQVQPGDFCVITATADQGIYLLTAVDPSQFSNWLPIGGTAAGGGAVSSVNGQTGAVHLTYTDLGAMAADVQLPISQVTGLASQLASFATTVTVNYGLAGKTSPSDVQTMLSNSVFVKRADYVATTAVSQAGQQSVDGVLVPPGALVLLTAQSNAALNGLWTVSSGTWSRPADYATGSYLAKNTVVIVNNATASNNGNTNATIWMQNDPSGFIDSNTSHWSRIGYTSAPFTPVQGNGITISGATFSAAAASGGGIAVTSTGIALDPAVGVRKVSGSIPPGNAAVGITHNLNTMAPMVAVYDVSGVLVLCGVQVTSANAVSLEFESAPASGQYRYAIFG